MTEEESEKKTICFEVGTEQYEDFKKSFEDFIKKIEKPKEIKVEEVKPEEEKTE